jgi:hypothetical protein
MAVDFSKTFGAQSQGTSNDKSTGSRSDQPKAKLWLNIGYMAEGAGENGEDRFVSLPVGIPVDTQEKVATNSRNQNYADFMAARNDLLDQIMGVAETLAPGEDRILNLQIQLRRVAEERQNIGVVEGNAFAKKLEL